MERNCSGQEQLQYLKQRMEILDQAIASLEQLAEKAGPFSLNLAAPEKRLYKCADRGFTNGRVRHARRANAMGTNFGR
jgi:hypothetical protein